MKEVVKQISIILKCVVCLITFIPSMLASQNYRLEIGMSIGNNGQLDNTLSDFYRINYYSTMYNNDISDTRLTGVKYSVSARYFIADNISARIKFGKIVRKDQQIQTGITTYSDYYASQTVMNLSPSLCFSKRINKFELMTGVEIPFIQVGDFSVKTNYKYMPNSVDISQKKTTNGGSVWGVNNFLGIKYFFKDWLSLGSEINYGLLFTKLGGRYTTERIEAPATTYTRNDSIVQEFKRTFFSTPEFSFGLFVQLGRNKSKN